MNTAQVTEAHITKARAYGYTTDKGVQMAAQFIANSEAAKAERDQLRAEVERLREWQAGVIANEKLHHAERQQAIARAERAEAELSAERARLDWLEGNAGDIPRYHSRSWIWIAHQNLREKIDAAMKEGDK